MGGFTYGGVDVGALGLTVLRAPRLLTPGAVFAARRVPGADRSVAAQSEYGPRELSLSCLVSGTSAADLRGRLDQIAAVLGSRTEKQLVLSQYPDRYWLARPAESPAVASVTVASATVDITFAALDPLAWGVAEVEQVASWPAAAGWNVVVGGTAETTPTVIYQATGAVSVVSFENSELDERVAWEGALGAGERLRFDCRDWTVHRAPASDPDDWAPAIAGVSGSFPRLQVGANMVRLLAPGAGTLRVIYRERWL